MYIPLLITSNYLLASTYWIHPDDSYSLSLTGTVLQNILLTEFLYLSLAIGTTTTSNFYPTTLPHEIFNILAVLLLQDIYFFYFHRLAHSHPTLKRIHHHHTQFCSFAAWHSHWLEHLLINIGSASFPFLLLPLHAYTLHFLIILMVTNVVYSHSKYNPYHIVHHTTPTVRFGTLYLIDRLLGTYHPPITHKIS